MKQRYIYIVFDGPPGPDGPRFVEVEDDKGRSIDIGKWDVHDDQLWSLRIPDPRAVDVTVREIVMRGVLIGAGFMVTAAILFSALVFYKGGWS